MVVRNKSSEDLVCREDIKEIESQKTPPPNQTQ